jgi:pyruvate dehydrogenase E2 component (dihydrolipoamide acetyltransferase)
MEQGNIASWAKNEGEYINPGDVMAEVETDKATVAYEAVDGGYLAKILVPAGSKDVPVGTPVAVLVEEQADIAAFAAYSGDAPAAAPAAAPASSSEPVTSTSSPTASASASPSSSSRVFASPAARKLASSKNFDIR